MAQGSTGHPLKTRKSQQTKSNHKPIILVCVVPVFNEKIGLQTTHETLVELMESQGDPFGIIISDNGSTDEHRSNSAANRQARHTM